RRRQGQQQQQRDPAHVEVSVEGAACGGGLTGMGGRSLPPWRSAAVRRHRGGVGRAASLRRRVGSGWIRWTSLDSLDCEWQLIGQVEDGQAAAEDFIKNRTITFRKDEWVIRDRGAREG